MLEGLSEVDQIFTDFFAKNKAPGLLYGVAVRGNLVHWKAIGDAVIGERPVDRTTAFRVASITKSFTAMALLKLRDRGLINLDAPFVTYMPELFPQQIEVFEVTVRQLLSMSAGFPTDDKWADRVESITDEHFLTLLETGFRFDTRPGSRFEYSNLGYALLGRIIANVSNMSYIQYVTQEIFFSLGLRSTTFDFTESVNLAMGYAMLDGWTPEPHQIPGAFSPIGGVITTLDDLVAWTNYLSSAFDPTSPEHGPLKKSSRREMQNIHREIKKVSSEDVDLSDVGTSGYGFGTIVEDDNSYGKIVSHSGGYPGFGAHMRWHLTSGISVISLANGRYASPVVANIPALRAVLSQLPQIPTEITRELEFIREKIVALIQNWNEETLTTFFAVNMNLDFPLDFRRKNIDEALAQTGKLSTKFQIKANKSASHLKWEQYGEKKNLEIEIWLAPLAPLQIQEMRVKAIDRVPEQPLNT